jgi:hypothetical protein
MKLKKHKRENDRIKPKETVIVEIFDEGKIVSQGYLCDANDNFIRIYSEEELLKEIYILKLMIPTIKNKKKIAKVKCIKTGINRNKKEYLFLYEPISELNKYFIDQYLLNKSLFIWSKISVN